MAGRVWRIFISYAREDMDACEKLEQHLADLKLSRRVDVWCDQRIEAGEEWEPEILARLNAAHIVLLLVSPAFMASRYCQEIELPRVMDRLSTGSVRVVPILLEPTDFQDRPFAKLQALPIIDDRELKAISLWNNQNEAYVAVAARLRRMLDALDGQGGAEDEEAFDRQRYLDAFIGRLNALDQGVGFLRDTFIEPGKDVADPAVDLTLDLLSRPVEHTTAPLVALIDTHRAHRVLVLLGDPGSGKSVLLRELGRELALRAQFNELAPLPLYLSLATYNLSLPSGGPQPLASFIREQLAISPRSAERALAPLTEQLLADGGLVLLLDGMDEMRRADFSERVNAIRAFTQQRARPRVIVACRRQDFPQKQFDAQQIRIEPFSEELIRSYLTRILGMLRAGELTEQILSPASGLAEMVNTPLYLSLLARYVKRRGMLPQTRADLLMDFVTPQLERALQERPGLELSRIRAELAELALVLIERGGVGTGVASSELLAALGGPARQRLAMLEAGLAAGLLRRDETQGDISFIHLRFLEFFTALALEQAPHSTRVEWLRQRVNAPWVHEVYILLAQLGVDLEEFLGEQLEEVEQTFSRIGEEPPREALSLPYKPPGMHEKVQRRSSVQQFGQQLHELRLILVGRMIEAAGLASNHPVVQRTASLLARLFIEAQELPLPELRRVRILRAIRGPLSDAPAAEAVLRKALASRNFWEQEEAYLAMAPLALTRPEVQARLVGGIRQRLYRDDFLLRYRKLKAIAMADPRLRFLRGPIDEALVRHIVLWLAILLLWACCWGGLLGMYGMLAVMGAMLVHMGYDLRRRRSVHERHPLHEVHFGALAMGVCFAAATLASVTFSEWVARQWFDWEMSHPLPAERERVLQWAAGSACFVLVLTSHFGFVAKLASFRGLCMLGTGAGLALPVLALLDQTPSLTGTWFGGSAGFVVASVLLLSSLAPEDKRLTAFAALPLIVGVITGYWVLAFFVIASAVERWSAVHLGGVPAGVIAAVQLIAFLLCVSLLVSAMSGRTTLLKQRVALQTAAFLIHPFVLKLFASLWLFAASKTPARIAGVIPYAILTIVALIAMLVLALACKELFLLVRTNRRAALLSWRAPREPLTLAELPDALRALTRGFILPGARKAATEKLSGLQPASEVLALALAHHAASEECRVDRALLAKTISVLQDRLQREPAPELSVRIKRELPVLAVLQAELKPRVFKELCEQWSEVVGIAMEALQGFVEAGDLTENARVVTAGLAAQQGKADHAA